MSEPQDIVFLLGAGAVVNVGLPTAVQLTKRAEEGIAANYEKLLPVLRYVIGSVQFGKSCRGEPLSDRINIEELLTACRFLATRHNQPAYPFVSAWHERVNEFQHLPGEINLEGAADSFGFLFSYSRGKLRDWLAIPDLAKLKYLWSFLSFIKKGYRLRIFTLNYDDCIEHALSETVGAINDKWTTGFNDLGWNPDLLSTDDYLAYVYKMHGSLDWIRDPDLGICSVAWPPAKWTEELPSDFDPLLIFGVDVKLQAVDPFLTLLYHFQQTLNTSRVLVVIGYSFGDEYINEMILAALQRDPQMRCIVVTPSGITALSERNPSFWKMIAVEQRFRELRSTAEQAFQSDAILAAVEEVFQVQETEEPF